MESSKMAIPFPNLQALLNEGLLPASDHEIAEQTQEDEKPACSICYEDFASPVKTPCGHIFCKEDLLHWLSTSTTCPLCKRVLYDPQTAPPQPAVDVEPLELDFTINEGAVVRGLNDFDTFVATLPRTADHTYPDFSCPPGSKVHIDFDSLLPRAVGAALWIKSDTQYGERTLADVCRTEWEWAVNEVKDFLDARGGRTMDAAQFRSRLSAEVNRYVTWKAESFDWRTKAEEMPGYAVSYISGRTLASDLDILYDYITWCAVWDYEKRAAPDFAELETSG